MIKNQLANRTLECMHVLRSYEHTHVLHAGRLKARRNLPRVREQHLHHLQIRGRYGNVGRRGWCRKSRAGGDFAGTAAPRRWVTRTCPKRDRRFASRRRGMALVLWYDRAELAEEVKANYLPGSSSENGLKGRLYRSRDRWHRVEMSEVQPANPEARMRRLNVKHHSSSSRNVSSRRARQFWRYASPESSITPAAAVNFLLSFLRSEWCPSKSLVDASDAVCDAKDYDAARKSRKKERRKLQSAGGGGDVATLTASASSRPQSQQRGRGDRRDQAKQAAAERDWRRTNVKSEKGQGRAGPGRTARAPAQAACFHMSA